MSTDDLPPTQALADAVAEELTRVAKSEGSDGVGSLLPALSTDSPLVKSIEDAFAPIRQALAALADRLDALEDSSLGPGRR